MKSLFILLAFVGTVYHAVPHQTDDTPQTTACLNYISDIYDPPKYIAVPQDWIGRQVECGDEILVICDCEVAGIWIVADVMNERYNYCDIVDFLVSPDIYTKYHDIEIYGKTF